MQRGMHPTPFAACLVVLLVAASTARADPAPPLDATRVDSPRPSKGDLFPAAGHASASAATGLPFLAIGEVGIAITDGIAIGAVGGITPSVLTAGIRPRFRVATSRNTSLVFIVPMLYYPRASAPGPGNIGSTTWVLARPELFFDGALGERWHVGGGMGFIAAASTLAVGQFLEGREFAMPAYNGSTETKRGFAGGIWNTIATRASFRTGEASHLFFEGSLVMKGVVPADGVGGPPIVVTLGMQHTF